MKNKTKRFHCHSHAEIDSSQKKHLFSQFSYLLIRFLHDITEIHLCVLIDVYERFYIFCDGMYDPYVSFQIGLSLRLVAAVSVRALKRRQLSAVVPQMTMQTSHLRVRLVAFWTVVLLS